MLKNLPGIILLSLLFLASACEKQKADIPAYISIKNFDFNVESEQGSRSQFITDAWVYVDDQTMGGFQIPARFPVLNEGRKVIKIRPGILLNGIENERAAYPYYEWFIDTIDLVRGAVTEVKPVFTYVAGTPMSLIEDFENPAALKFSRTSRADTIWNLVSGPEAYEGTYSAKISINPTNELFEVKSFNTFSMPTGKSVFLELDCKTNHAFSVGIFANYGSSSQQVTSLVVYPASGGDKHWKKLYVNLTQVIRTYFDATDFNVFLGALNSGTEGVIYLDNIKLVGV